MSDGIRQKYDRLNFSIPVSANKKDILHGLIMLAAGLDCVDRAGRGSASALVTMLGGLAADNPVIARRIIEALAPIFDVDTQKPIME